jgi:hypothetical protein
MWGISKYREKITALESEGALVSFPIDKSVEQGLNLEHITRGK